MIIGFKNEGTADVFDHKDSKAARKVCPNNIWKVAERKLDYLQGAVEPSDLRIPPGNKLEELSGDRLGQQSIRINEKYRICFYWSEQGAEDVKITDYH